MRLVFITALVAVIVVLPATAAAQTVVVDPHLDVSPPAVTPPLVFLDAESKTITISSWILNNTGSGDVCIGTATCPNTGIQALCPAGQNMSCVPIEFVSGTIPQGEFRTTRLNVSISCRSEDFSGDVGINVTYDDAYDLETIAPQSNTSFTTLSISAPKPSLAILDTNKEQLTAQSWELGQEYALDWTVQNNGTGDINLTADALCPALGCRIVSAPAILTEGQSADISMAFTPTCEAALFPTLILQGQYDDNYGLTCLEPKTFEDSVSLAEWFEKKPDGCACSYDEECASDFCLEGMICATLTKPEISYNLTTPEGIPVEVFGLEVGTTGQLAIKLSNTMPIEDTISLHLQGVDCQPKPCDPKRIELWSWFTGHQYDEQKLDLSLDLMPNEERAVVINILGGKTGTYQLKIWGESEATGLRSESIITVSIEQKGAKELFGVVSGLSWAAVFAILACGIFLARKRF